ncbi:MAG: tRNA (guanosine(37)-N1)-methyltransferase TrmD [Dissulfuribacterales bacterium]
MLFDILTIFPGFFSSPLQDGLLFKAIQKGLIQVRPINLRDFTHDRHNTVDDRPYGGGEGMVMKPEPIYEALEALRSEPLAPYVVLLSPRGRLFDQQMANEWAVLNRLLLVCGRYEGIDERVTGFVNAEVSIGDYVLFGGEAAALVILEAVARLIPGVLGCETSSQRDSFSDGLLESPCYTRPPDFLGQRVPEVLLSGDHARISRWRREQSLLVTLQRRPDLLKRIELSETDREFLEKLGWSCDT